ncbi:hypothetical protein D6089_09470 [Vibrio vulnificus]|nr:hypothetical protein [Vibrio vulnificus]
MNYGNGIDSFAHGILTPLHPPARFRTCIFFSFYFMKKPASEDQPKQAPALKLQRALQREKPQKNQPKQAF